MAIADLAPGTRGVELKVKVVEKKDEREVTVKATGQQHRVGEFIVGDESGTIILSLWDEAIDKMEVNGIYEVKNAYVSTFRNSMRLNTGRYGTIEPSEGEFEVNAENNVSDKFVEDSRRRF